MHGAGILDNALHRSPSLGRVWGGNAGVTQSVWRLPVAKGTKKGTQDRRRPRMHHQGCLMPTSAAQTSALETSPRCVKAPLDDHASFRCKKSWIAAAIS